MEINAGENGDGSVFRIWSVTPNHTLFVRILTEPDGYASYLVATAQEIFPEPLRFLPLASRHRQRRARHLLRRWGVVNPPNQSRREMTPPNSTMPTPSEFNPVILFSEDLMQIHAALVASGRADLAAIIENKTVRSDSEQRYLNARPSLDENEFDFDAVPIVSEGEHGAYVSCWFGFRRNALISSQVIAPTRRNPPRLERGRPRSVVVAYPAASPV